ncbi:MAG: hypothetical protein WC551_11000 [Patescibacteria group bacterium]
MQAILCTYFPATNTRGSRIRASCAAGSITIGYPYELGAGEEAHAAAAMALAHKLGWTDRMWISGSVGDDYVFVCAAVDGGYTADKYRAGDARWSDYVRS